MAPLTLISASVLILGITEIQAQYNTPSPYDRERQDQYDRDRNRDQNDNRNQYDRQNNPPYGQYDRRPPYDQHDRQYNTNYNQSQYDRDRQYNPYNNQSQYDRDRQYNPYNQSNYDRQNQSQYGNQGPPYGNRDPYNQDRPYNRDPYGNNRDNQYGNNRDQYNRDQQYGGNRDQQYGGNRDQQYGGNRDQYGNAGNRDPYGTNRDQQYGSNRDQYGNSNNSNRDQYYTGNRDQYGSSGFGGPQYGSPIIDTNDNCCREYCYTRETQPYLNFATKTAYEIVYGKQSNQHNIPDCTPVQFWSINRHGTRYPSARSIARLRGLSKIQAEVIRNYDERRSYPDRGRLCSSDLDLFRRWRWNDTINERNANALTSQGIDDLKYLARRYATRFENLMREPYSENTYTFQYTDTDRTHDSYQAYIEGLFRDKAYQVHANVYNQDRLIKPTSTCNSWTRQVQDNPQTMYEYFNFKQKPEYQQMVRDVFRRLGFRYTLNDTVLKDMYDLCRYEKAWNLQQPSPWCIVFNEEQLKLLEYAEDLKSYYKSGYGNEINKKVGCPPVKDLYEKFERTVSGNSNGNKVSVFFTHSVTIQTFLTAMGIAQDYQPLTSNYLQQQNRKWRTSTIDPFASNLAAILYQCRTGERNRVMFFLNEVPMNYPECSVGLCNWSAVQAKLQSVATNCNLDFCDWSAATALERSYVIYLTSLIAIVFTSIRL